MKKERKPDNPQQQQLNIADVSNLLCVKGKRPDTCRRYTQQRHGCNYCKNFKHNNC